MPIKKKPVTKAALTNGELSANIELKKLEAQELDLNITSWKEREFKNEEQYIRMNKVGILRNLLESTIVEENTIPGSEVNVKPSFSEQEREIIKDQIMDIITKF